MQCYLYSVNSCCNQLDKRIKKDNYISGFNCPKCWSTVGECPCSDKDLRDGIQTQFASGAVSTRYATATVCTYSSIHSQSSCRCTILTRTRVLLFELDVFDRERRSNHGLKNCLVVVVVLVVAQVQQLLK